MIKKCNFAILLGLVVSISFIVSYKNPIRNAEEVDEKNNLAVVANVNTNIIEFCKENFGENINEDELKGEIERIYKERSEAFISGEVTNLKSLFDTSQKSGKLALERESKRIKYLNDWGSERNITFVKIESIVRVNKVYPQGSIIKMDLEESNKFNYIYNNDDNCPINSFGIRIRHTTSLLKKEGVWVICNDRFNDCFEDAINNYSNNDSNSETEISFVSNGKKDHETASGAYDRQKAVAYADKYCGATGGSVIGIGTFKELIEGGDGPVRKIQLGDLVGYERFKHNIDHFSVVTGFDSHGYPLVDSNTTDRYHAPWDLGWNKTKTRFYLIHINK